MTAIFQEGKLAVVAANSKFVSVSPDDDGIVAHSITAGPDQILKVIGELPRIKGI